MKGIILEYNVQHAKGLISGDDGNRYAFVGSDVADRFSSVRAGIQVDFTAEQNGAKNIYPLILEGGEKSRIAAALLALFLGGLGIHKFYLGKNNAGAAMLVGSVLGVFFALIPTIIIGIIALVESIIYLTKSDNQFYQEYVAGDRLWF